ncbi:MAG TPA: hypothetical protein VFV98_20670 [Vicinamibacterales bacterium]|nr:hypothetical protein [Vicinamibacterales bacterium]
MTVSSSKRGAGGGALTGAGSNAAVVDAVPGSAVFVAGVGAGHCAGGGAGCVEGSARESGAEPYRVSAAGGVCVFVGRVGAGVAFLGLGAGAIGARDALRLRSAAGSTGTVVSVRGAFGSDELVEVASGVVAGDDVAGFSATEVAASAGASDFGFARSAR